MAAFYTIRVTLPNALDPDPAQTGADNRLSCYQLGELVKNCAEGVFQSGASLTADMRAVQASGTLTLSSASGTVGGIINGVTITVTAAGGDTATAVLIAAAINASANALVSGFVTAASNGAVVTITAVNGGVGGNAQTLAATGTGVTASGARLTGGSAASSVSYTF